MENIQIEFINTRKTVSIDTPEWCPHCGRNTSPALVSKSQSQDILRTDFARFSVTYRCSYSDCKKYFALEYSVNPDSLSTNIKTYSYRPPIKVNLPRNIEKVSPDFVEIYGQATVAEAEKLEQVAGVGYRKSAEFLLKDFAIYKKPENQDQIKTMPLGQVISTYFSKFPKIQTLAKAISWIGNDETHYIRKHDDKDIQDLKRFILACAQFIASEYDFDEALRFTSSN
ncbi:DUF4145 domain-containing protein [Streptococcus sp. 10F2]